jgi:ABC-type spermidine/putrescine transport system permease subunit I
MKRFEKSIQRKEIISMKSLFILPIVIALIVLFVIPLGQVLWQAFIHEGSFSLYQFNEIFTSNQYIEVFVRTFRIALITTIITLVFGYALAYYIVFKSDNKRFLVLLLFVTMMVDIVIRIFGWLISLSRGGVVAIVTEPLLGQDSYLFTEVAIIIGMVGFTLPFVTFAVVGVLTSIDKSLLEASRNLGASRLQAFRYVTLPLSSEGIQVGGSLVFAISMSAFVTPQLLGGARNRMVANTIYNLVDTTNNWELASALALVLLVVTTAILLIFGRGTDRSVGGGV